MSGRAIFFIASEQGVLWEAYEELKTIRTKKETQKKNHKTKRAMSAIGNSIVN